MAAGTPSTDQIPTGAGLRAELTRGLLPWWLLRTNEMVMLEVRQVKPLPRALDSIEIRWSTRDDEPLLQQIRPRQKTYARHFDDGCLGMIGLVDRVPASYCWFERRGVHTSRTNGYQFHYGADTAWVFGFEVKPEFRISGIFHKHWLVALELLAPLGISRVVGTIQADNPHSLQSHRRLGFRPLCRYRMTRVCGVLQYQVTPEDGSSVSARSGLQAWPVSIRG